MCLGISRYGSSGEEVKQIQKKLKEWGYYNGDVDGIYGSKTFSAVKKFQEKNGWHIDWNRLPKEVEVYALALKDDNETDIFTITINKTIIILLYSIV